VLANRERRGKSGEEKESRGGREVRWRTYAPPRVAACHHWTCGRRAFLSSVLPASHSPPRQRRRQHPNSFRWRSG
jgi:hypothetical protein